MTMKIKPGNTLPQFRDAMRQSISAFYAQRGLPGKTLYDFSRELQSKADILHEQGTNKAAIKKSLDEAQAPMLEFSRPFFSGGQKDETFTVVHQGGLSENELNLCRGDKIKFVENLLTHYYIALMNGTIASEGHYAGRGTRLESPKPKFNMTAKDLLESLSFFSKRIDTAQYKDDDTYTALDAQIKSLGGLEEIKKRFGSLHDWTVGERIFLAKINTIYSIARNRYWMSNEDFTKILHSLKFKIIVNADSGAEIIENFVRTNFFGLNPYNIIFMNQAKHPTWEVGPEGELIADENYQSQGNHGLLPFQSNLENQWFRIIPDSSQRGYKEENLTTTDYRDFQSGITTLVVESVEDTTQYVKPYDGTYLSYVEKFGRELGIQMFMKIVNQKKENPQKGGFLAAIDNGRGNGKKNGVIESNRAPNLTPAMIRELNLNRNAFYNPNAADDATLESDMIHDLHPTFEPQGKDMVLRIDPKIPQGDRNLYLRSLYIKDAPAPSISNLKDPVDIIPTLERMKEMESDPQVIQTARAIGLIGSKHTQTFISGPLAVKHERLETKAKKRMLTFEDILIPQLIGRMTTTAKEHLLAAQALFEIKGSLVRRYEIESPDDVYLKTIPETLKGEAEKYPSGAMKRRTASDSKAPIARGGDRIFWGTRYEFDVIDIPNPQSAADGEIITFIIKLKGPVAKDQLARLFEGKIRHVIEKLGDMGITGKDEETKKLFLDLTPEEIFFKRADEIAKTLSEKLVEAIVNDGKPQPS